MSTLDEQSQPRNASAPQRAKVAESPWLWFAMFLVFALAALAVIGPKHAARQTRLVRMHEARQQARFRAPSEAVAEVQADARATVAVPASERAAAPPVSGASSHAGASYRGVSLTPLACFVAAVLVLVSAAAVYRLRVQASHRGRAQQGSGP